MQDWDKSQNLSEVMDNLDKSIVDIENLDATDVKINSDFYIHVALLRVQQMLSYPNLNELMIHFRIAVEHLEVLVRSAGHLTAEYQVKIDAYLIGDEYKNYVIENQLIASYHFALYKYRLLTEAIFMTKVSNMPLKI